MNGIKQRIAKREESHSRCLKYIGVPIVDNNNKLLNGEKTLGDGTIVRFVNGLIDGNIYDDKGNIVDQHPAVEYPLGQEFWEKGVPKGYPAISQNMGYYEEDWDEKSSDIVIREEYDLTDITISE